MSFILKLRIKYKIKGLNINLASLMMCKAFKIIVLSERYFPRWLDNILFELYQIEETLGHRWFGYFYEGSIQEIQDAFEHSGEHWLSPFQKMIAEGKILGMPV